jgi:hypothetical protein
MCARGRAHCRGARLLVRLKAAQQAHDEGARQPLQQRQLARQLVPPACRQPALGVDLQHHLDARDGAGGQVDGGRHAAAQLQAVDEPIAAERARAELHVAVIVVITILLAGAAIIAHTAAAPVPQALAGGAGAGAGVAALQRRRLRLPFR